MKQQVKSALWILFAATLCLAQPPQGENVTFYGMGRTGYGPPWTADSLWLGGVFLRDTTKPLIVLFSTSSAGVQGQLSIMNPANDTAIPLFTNQVPPNTRVDVSYLAYHNLDTVVFAYPAAGPPWSESRALEYSGPNRRRGDSQNFAGFDRFSSDRYIPAMAIPGKPFAPLRRFFVAGWATDPVSVQKLDRVEFGVEDGSDFDFNDCIFMVSGVFLNKPTIASSIVVTTDPPLGNVRAGDSISLFATVMIDSAQTGRIKSSPELSEQVTWKITSSSAGATLKYDSLSPGSTNTFVGTRAYTTYTITASYRDTVRSMQSSIQITILPGQPYAVFIERDSLPNKWKPDTLSLVYLPYSVDTARVYAIERDVYQNFVGPATDPHWTSSNAGNLPVSSDSAKPWKGYVYKTHLGLQPDTSMILLRQSLLLPDSSPAIAEYRIRTDPPVFAPPPENYLGSVTVALTSATPGAVIWYCVNCDTIYPGDSLAVMYSDTAPIRLSGAGSQTIRAFATKSDLRYLPSPVVTGVYTNLDAVGPFIDSVFYYSGTLADPSASPGNDTLVVYFSEPVPCSLLVDPRAVAGVFAYRDRDAVENEMTIFTDAHFPAQCRDSTVSRIAIIAPPTRKITPLEDSLRLKGGAIADRYGNLSLDSARAVQIRWGRAYSLWVVAGPNPFNPASDYVPSYVRDLVAPGSRSIPSPAACIEIVSVKSLDPTKSYAVVLDAVGNRIQDRLPVLAGKDKRTYFVFWDGTNRWKRLVASGSYLSIVYLKETSGAPVSPIKRKIGISR